MFFCSGRKIRQLSVITASANRQSVKLREKVCGSLRRNTTALVSRSNLVGMGINMIDTIKNFKVLLTACVNDRKGVTALEYGVIAAATIVIGLAGFGAIGTDVANIFTNVAGKLVPAA